MTDWSRTSLTEEALAIVTTADAREKAARSRDAAAAFAAGKIVRLHGETPPDMPARPARPEKPVLCPPTQVPRRPLGSPAGRMALLHALAHIELNAIDLAWDLIGRFGHEMTDRAFFEDWAQVGGDEGVHFLLLDDRLAELGGAYGDFPAHDGLWEAAEDTAHDVLARLAVVPLVLEARGLDVCPDMARKLRSAGDEASAQILDRIYEEEIGHVAAGMRWFTRAAEARGRDPVGAFQDSVKTYFKGRLKAPFNRLAREKAGLLPQFYQPLSAG